ncbi:hypothetical protein [Streptosporangium sp. NPDC051022]|uniref:hypothetical protein n=1 Tax=Streptosporangium sp. NPDC051022 TaxID=3155752 RepID=UPI0034252FF6
MIVIPDVQLGQMKAQMARASERVGPVAVQARDMAGHARDMADHARDTAGHVRDTANDRIYVARGWAAPKLDAAAHSVEEQLAPKVSALLSQAASRIDPTPRRVRSRKGPMLLLFTGIAIGAVGFAMYRRSADQWTEAMKETASDASRWASDKARSVSGKTSGTADEATATVGAKAEQLGDKAEQKADQVGRKMS